MISIVNDSENYVERHLQMVAEAGEIVVDTVVLAVRVVELEAVEAVVKVAVESVVEAAVELAVEAAVEVVVEAAVEVVVDIEELAVEARIQIN